MVGRKFNSSENMHVLYIWYSLDKLAYVVVNITLHHSPCYYLFLILSYMLLNSPEGPYWDKALTLETDCYAALGQLSKGGE